MYKLISEEMPQKIMEVTEWNDESEEAFRKLKEICTTIPILAYADFSKAFKLHTDACTMGLRAILCQIQDGVDHVIGYASRSLSKTEHKYPAHKQEFLALKSTVIVQFHEYLYGNYFVVYTDNNPLTYPLTSAKLDATGHHWVAGFANYNFALNHHSGKINVDVDALSFIPKGEYDWYIQADSAHALISLAVQGTTLMEPTPVVYKSLRLWICRKIPRQC